MDTLQPKSVEEGITDETKPLLGFTTPILNKECNLQDGGKVEDEKPLPEDGQKSLCSNCCRYLATLTIEPPTFFFMFAFMMNVACVSNLIMDKGCLHYFNYTKEVCSNLSGHEDVKTSVEILANNYTLYCNLTSLIAAIIMIFVTPWSDKYGRKPPLVLTCAGSALSDFGMLFSVLYFESSLNYLILIRLLSEIVGGYICFWTIIYSHAAEVTTEQNRTLKYTTIEITFVVAMSFGGFAGGMILAYYGYFYVFLTAMVLHISSALWVIFIVEETAGVGSIASFNEKIRDFFGIDSILRSWKAVVQPRGNKERLSLWMYFVSMCIVILTYEVFGGLAFVYAHHIYNWDPAMFNMVVMIFSLLMLAVMFLITPLFLKVFKMSDPVLGMIGTLSMMGKNSLTAFAKYKLFIYYIANVAGLLSGFTTLAIRAGISKLTNKEETGLVFSFLATCEQIFPILGSILSTKLFNATIDIYPSVIYLLSVVFLSIPLGTFIWMYIKSSNDKKVERKKAFTKKEIS